LQALAKSGAEILRTDLNVTIIFETDGQTITVQKQKNSIQPRAPVPSVTEDKRKGMPLKRGITRLRRLTRLPTGGYG